MKLSTIHHPLPTVRGFSLLEAALVLMLMAALLTGFANAYFSMTRLRGAPEAYLLLLESAQTGMDFLTREIRGARNFATTANSIAFSDPRGTGQTIRYQWGAGGACGGSGICVTRSLGGGSEISVFPSAIEITSFTLNTDRRCPDGSNTCQPKYTFTLRARVPVSRGALLEREFVVGVTPRFLQM